MTLNLAFILQRLKPLERSLIVERFARETVQKTVVAEQVRVASEQIRDWKAKLPTKAERRKALQMLRVHVFGKFGVQRLKIK